MKDKIYVLANILGTGVFSFQLATDGAFLTDDDRLFYARAEATGKVRSPSVERLVDGTTSMAESAERRRRRRQMSGAGSQQGTPALFHKDSGRPERTLAQP